MWKQRTNLRVALALLGLLGALLLPIWIPILVALILALFWRAWEVLCIGLLIDFAWSPVHSFPYFTLGAVILVWILEPIRKEFLSR